MTEITVTVDAENVRVDGTTKDDEEARAALKAAGFRWARSLGAWVLPRNLRPETRRADIARFVSLMAGHGRAVDVEDSGRTLTAAEAREHREERLTARADRYEVRAERRTKDAEDAYTASRRAVEHIPFGQPILVGHHSEAGHRADLRRAERAMDRSVAAQRAADRAERLAAGIRRELERGTPVVTVKRRLDRNETELRKLLRGIEEATPGSEWLAHLETCATVLVGEVDLDKAILERLAEEGRTRLWGPGDFRKGDGVRIRGRWRRVVRVNGKSLSVETGYSWHDRVPYAEVTARSRDGVDQTAADLAGERQ